MSDRHDHPPSSSDPRDEPRSSEPATGTLLEAVRLLDHAAEPTEPVAPPLLIGLTDGPDDGRRGEPGRPRDLAHRPILGTDPVAGLLRFDAPGDWRALVVIVEGRARALDDGAGHDQARVDHDPAHPVRVTLGVDRSGAVASVVRDRTAGSVVETDAGRPATGGRLVEVCLRSLGVTTPPPPPDSTELWTVLWLDRVLAHCVAGTRVPRSGPELEALHPASRMLNDAAHPVAEVGLGPVGESFGRVLSWSTLRRMCAEGGWSTPDLGAADAAWLDDGAFARWVLGGFLPVEAYVAELRPHLPPSLIVRIEALVAGWPATGSGRGSW